MTKKHSKKTLELGKHTIFGREGGGGGQPDPRKKNCECWSLFHVPPPPWNDIEKLDPFITLQKRYEEYGSLLFTCNIRYNVVINVNFVLVSSRESCDIF
jgi:hypothetical protein